MPSESGGEGGGSLQNVAVAVLELNFPGEELESLKSIIKREGGELRPPCEANVLVSALQSPSRIGRHLPRENPEIPVVKPEWVHESAEFGFVQPYGEYQIEIPVELRPKKFKHRRISIDPSSMNFNDDSDEICSTDEENAAGSDVVHRDWDLSAKYECQFRTPIAHKNAGLVTELAVIARDREFEYPEQPERAIGYQRAISTLKAYPRDVRTNTEAKSLRFIGNKISTAMKEYRRKGSITEANQIRSRPDYEARELFLQVRGAGPKKVANWLRKGYKTIQDVINGEVDEEAELASVFADRAKRPHSSSKLSASLRYGLKYFDALREGMTGQDAEEIIAAIAECAERATPGSKVEPVGEYRRGHRENISSTDVLVVSPHAAAFIGLMTRLLKELERKDLCEAILTELEFTAATGSPGEPPDKKRKKSGSMPLTNSAKENEPISKLFVIFKQKSSKKLRMVHIYVIPPASRPYALLLNTGSERFRRSLHQYLEEQKHLDIKTHGVWVRDSVQRLPTVESEEMLFEQLGLDWIPPELRNC